MMKVGHGQANQLHMHWGALDHAFHALHLVTTI